MMLWIFVVFLSYEVVLWVVLILALDWGTFPVSPCRVALGFLWPTLADLDVVL
jgi:hypothetical protein